jgi:hypothetical protein
MLRQRPNLALHRIAGLGWLMGKHGLACDNVLEVELVTAEGRTFVANAQTNEALY